MPRRMRNKKDCDVLFHAELKETRRATLLRVQLDVQFDDDEQQQQQRRRRSPVDRVMADVRMIGGEDEYREHLRELHQKILSDPHVNDDGTYDIKETDDKTVHQHLGKLIALLQQDHAAIGEMIDD